jgi:hypothetical protein
VEFSCCEYRGVLPWILIFLGYSRFSSVDNSTEMRRYVENGVGIFEPALKIQFDNLPHKYFRLMNYLRNNRS